MVIETSSAAKIHVYDMSSDTVRSSSRERERKKKQFSHERCSDMHRSKQIVHLHRHRIRASVFLRSSQKRSFVPMPAWFDGMIQGLFGYCPVLDMCNKIGPYA
jgi:hypothetical protein